MINSFRGEYHFLSNFFDRKVTYNNITFLNNEAAFQSQKTLDIKEQENFSQLPPNIAKSQGRKVKLRTDWEEVKDQIMYEIVKAKFDQNPDLKKLLLQTGNEKLIEGNTWHDNYWGVCSCKSCKLKTFPYSNNHLGIILMKLREEYKN